MLLEINQGMADILLKAKFWSPNNDVLHKESHWSAVPVLPFMESESTYFK